MIENLDPKRLVHGDNVPREQFIRFTRLAELE